MVGLLTELSQDLVEMSVRAGSGRGTESQVSSWGRRLARSLSGSGGPGCCPGKAMNFNPSTDDGAFRLERGSMSAVCSLDARR